MYQMCGIPPFPGNYSTIVRKQPGHELESGTTTATPAPTGAHPSGYNHWIRADESRKELLQKGRDRERARRQNETAEQRQLRLQKNRERQRVRRMNETPEARVDRLRRETPEQRQLRLLKNRERERIRRLNETPEQRMIRLQKGRERERLRRMNDSPDQRRERLRKNCERQRRRRQSQKGRDDDSVSRSDSIPPSLPGPLCHLLYPGIENMPFPPPPHPALQTPDHLQHQHHNPL